MNEKEEKEVVIKYFDSYTGEMHENAEMALKAQQERQEIENQNAGNKNPPFIQLTKGVSPSVLSKIASESAVAIQVLMYFFENMDDFNFILVSQNTIASAIGRTRKSINQAVKVLEDNGAIGTAKVGNAIIYIVNPDVAWQKGFKERGVVKVRATVLLGKEENEKLFKRLDEKFHVNKDSSLSLKSKSISTRVVKGDKTKSEIRKQQQAEMEELDKAQAFYEQFEADKADEEREY